MIRIARIDAMHMEADDDGRIYPVFIDSFCHKWVPRIEDCGMLSWVKEVE